MLRLCHQNLATIPAIYAWVRDEFSPKLEQVRWDRRGLEERWRRYDRIWSAQLDRQSYHGRHKIYLAAGRRMLEAVSEQLTAGFFPMSEWYATLATTNVTDDEQAAAVHELQRHFLEKTMRVQFHFEPFVRQLVRLGTSPIKHVWHEQEQFIRRLAKQPDKRKKLGYRLETVTEAMKTCYGPVLRPVELYSWFGWPETVGDVSDLILQWEDKEVTKSHLRTMAKRWMDPEDSSLGHVYEKIEDALERVNIPKDFKQFRREKLEKLGVMTDPAFVADMPAEHAMLSECYWHGEIPDATHVDPETGEEVEVGPTDWIITLVDSTFPVRVQQNPFFRPRAPWHVPRLFRVVDEFYGHGMLEAVDRVQYLMNDLVNHTMDGLTMSMNPIAIIDPNAQPRVNTLRYLPGAKWLARPDAVRFDRAVDTSATGWQALNQLQGSFQDYGLPAPNMGQAAARGRGRMQNSASGMAMISQAGNMTIAGILRSLGQDFGVPMLRWNLEYVEQFMDDPIMLRIAGKGAGALLQKRIAAEDVLGDYAFTWLAGQALQERSTLTAQMERLVPLLVQIQQMADQRAATQGGKRITIHFDKFAMRLLQDGLNLHGAQDLISTDDDLPSLDPELENMLILEDRPVQVNPGDDNPKHLASHYAARAHGKYSGYRLLRLEEHIQEQEQAFAAQLQQMQQMQMQQQMAAMQMAQGGGMGGGGNGGPPGVRPQSMPSGAGQGPPEMADMARGMQLGPGV